VHLVFHILRLAEIRLRSDGLISEIGNLANPLAGCNDALMSVTIFAGRLVGGLKGAKGKGMCYAIGLAVLVLAGCVAIIQSSYRTDGKTCGFAYGLAETPGASPAAAVIPITAQGTAQGAWHGRAVSRHRLLDLFRRLHSS
jgi:hypothetical protein